jgi:arylsulfatase
MDSHEDFIPLFAAAAGEPDLVAKVKQGDEAGFRTFKVHFDCFTLIPFFSGDLATHGQRVTESPETR